jgi:serine/threonine protein phosphatase PrpC
VETKHTDAQEGDIVMLFTDGFSENMFDNYWTSCINSFLDQETGKPTSLSAIADCQVRQAYENSKLEDATPFAEKSKTSGKPKASK